MRGSKVEDAAAMTAGMESKGLPCSFLSKIPNYDLKPEERKRFHRKSKKKKELYISFYNQYLVWGDKEDWGPGSWSIKSMTDYGCGQLLQRQR